MARQIATFVLGKTLLGLDILLVKEVYRSVSITPIPDAPEHIRGLMNLRGRVVTVMDLNTCLGRQTDGKGQCRKHGQFCGILFADRLQTIRFWWVLKKLR